MKANVPNLNRADLMSKTAFVIRLAFMIAIACALLMIIAKTRIAVRDYHKKQQTARQKQTLKES